MRSRGASTTALALTVALSASAPVASADPRDRARAQPSPRAGATIVRVEDRSGFDWADAGIGAAGGFALSVLSVGAVLLVSDRRQTQRERKEGSCVC